jgi:uncharacterized RDD family membrane protein YckC
MSHDGNPPDQPEPGPDHASSGAAGASPPGPDPADPPPADEGDEKAWSPYPDNWDTQPKPATPHGNPPPYAGALLGSAPPTNPYGGAAMVSAPAFAFGGFASWLSRVGAYLIDAILGWVAGFPLWIGYIMLFSSATTTTDSNGVQHAHVHQSGASLALILIGALTSLAFLIWNTFLRQGRTGASIGKGVLGLRLVDKDLQPIGGGMAFLRYLLHVVDALPCSLGYLWPIWDSQKQTFADKIMGTVVIYANKPQPRVY